jgi:tRNA-dihydrouridine synthase
MIGRGAYGAPWLPGRVAGYLATGTLPAAPSLAEQAKIACEHVQAMLVHYGAQLGLRNARKHIGWYLEQSGRPSDGVKAWRRQLCTDDDPARVLQGLSSFYDDTREAAA